jgi:hypothetical protein
MMRTTSLLALGLLAGAAAFGATPWESATYVDGNVKDLSPNTGGTLQFPDDKTLVFNAGGKSIPVPYASIDKAELGPTKTHSHDVPLYKIWALSKRKTQTQYLSLGFKTADGEENNMTLELPESTAPAVLSKIQVKSGLKSAAATPAPDHDEGWGDDFWKTNRNADKWNTKTVASNQQ